MKKIFLVLVMSLLVSPAFAEDKSWNAGGDKASWTDDANWLPSGAPTASSDVLVDMLDTKAEVSETFTAKSLTLGGKKASQLTVDNFVAGAIEPSNASNLAVHNRNGGYMIMKGSAGKVTLRGTYKSTKQAVADEPSFMLYVQ